MEFNKQYEAFMESKKKDFFVEISSLYSSREKLENAVECINKKKYSYSRNEPILVSKMAKGNYYIVDGNHRVLEYANEQNRSEAFHALDMLSRDKTVMAALNRPSKPLEMDF